jgi:hypothetical protein
MYVSCSIYQTAALVAYIWQIPTSIFDFDSYFKSVLEFVLTAAVKTISIFW